MTVKELLDVMDNGTQVKISSTRILIFDKEVNGNVMALKSMLNDKVLNAYVKSIDIDDDEANIRYVEEKE